MDQELETVAAASAGGFLRFRRKAPHAAPVGSPCANCGVALQGPWCHACGQLGEDFHRSTPHLLGEAAESLFHFDGRFWRTIPRLVADPAGLTRDFLDGHRAPQIPPLRLFLVVLLMVFVAGSLAVRVPASLPVTGQIKINGDSVVSADNPALTAAQRAQLARAITDAKVELGNKPNPPATQWLKSHLVAAINQPERFFSAIEQWSERFAFLLLPMSTLLLSLVFVFQRRFYVFDHAIFSLHSLSAVGLLLTATFLLSPLTGGLANWLLLLAPVHLFVHMRGMYRTSVLGTLVRMVLVFSGSVAGFTLLILGLISVGLNAVGG